MKGKIRRSPRCASCGKRPAGRRSVEEIIRFNPSYGSSDQLFITWLATGLHWVGMDADQDEVMETGWFTFDEINKLIARGEMPDGLSLVPLLQLMAQRRSGPLTA